MQNSLILPRTFRTYRLLILSFVTAVLLLFGCKKIDTVEDATQLHGSVSKFFETRTRPDALVTRIIADLKSNEEKNPFAANFAKKNGYPIWDKVKTFKRAGSVNNTTSLVNGNGDTLVFIPLVEENGTRVHGFIQASLSDTITYVYTLTQDYKNYPEKATSTLPSSTDFAYFIMLLDKQVFDLKSFNISDPVLFRKHSDSPIVTRVDLAHDNNSTRAPSEACARITLYTASTPWGTMEISYCVTVFDLGDDFPSGGGDETPGPGGGGGPIIPHAYPCPPNTPVPFAATAFPDCPPPGPVVGWVPISPNIPGINEFFTLTTEQTAFLEQNPSRGEEIFNFFEHKYYDELTREDKIILAQHHLNELMANPDYVTFVSDFEINSVTMHPWMIELFKELAIEIGFKIVKKYLPGYSDLNSIKDAIQNASHGDWLSAAGEILNVIKKKVPILAALDAVYDIYDYSDEFIKVKKVFAKIQRLPSQAYNSLVKTIKNRCGGLLGKLDFDGDTQGLLKYDPNDALNFFNEFANDIPGIGMHNPAPGVYYFELGPLKFTFYPVSSSALEPSIEVSQPGTTWKYKIRFRL